MAGIAHRRSPLALAQALAQALVLCLSVSMVLSASAAAASTGSGAPVSAASGVSASGASTSAASVASVALVYCKLHPTFTVAQVIWVDGAGSRQVTRLCAKVGPGRYIVQGGPYAGHVGRGGVAAPRAKREGDAKTPYGSYPMRSGFGIRANPGLRASWFVATSRDIWVDDSRSRLYNTHQRTPVNRRWTSAEKLRVSPAYNHAQVIGYNEKRVPGRGSAIFLHVDQGRGTSGCVSLPTASLLNVLRWEKPGAWMWITQ